MSAEREFQNGLKRFKQGIEEQIAKKKEELAKLKRKLSGVKNSEKTLLDDGQERVQIQPSIRPNGNIASAPPAEHDSIT